MEHTIDAAGKSIGRVATEAATFLMGKNRTDFVRHQVPNVSVIVMNAGKLAITPKKASEKVYTRYSGYPGGLKSRTLAEVLDKKGYEEVVVQAVKGMLPKNKLQAVMLKNLSVRA